MQQIKMLLFSALLSLASFGQSSPSGLTGSCRNGGDYPKCVGGEVVFSGENYPAQVHVSVTNGAGKMIDNGDYVTMNGNLSFTENLSFADTYTISLDNHAVLTVSTN